jgi:hypothetical protein
MTHQSPRSATSETRAKHSPSVARRAERCRHGLHLAAAIRGRTYRQRCVHGVLSRRGTAEFRLEDWCGSAWTVDLDCDDRRYRLTRHPLPSPVGRPLHWYRYRDPRDACPMVKRAIAPRADRAGHRDAGRFRCVASPHSLLRGLPSERDIRLAVRPALWTPDRPHGWPRSRWSWCTCRDCRTRRPTPTAALATHPRSYPALTNLSAPRLAPTAWNADNVGRPQLATDVEIASPAPSFPYP